MDVYFQNFPLIYYTFDINNEPVVKIVRDVTINVRIRRKILENIKFFDEYFMDDGETPDIVAEKYYGSPLYQWVVMLCNQRYNLIEDYPMDQHTFLAYLDDKYKSVEVPTFPNVHERNVYLHLYGLDKQIVYNGNSSDAVEWKANTRYSYGQLIKNGDNYYQVIKSGVSRDYFAHNTFDDAIEWESFVYYNEDSILKYENRYYIVTQSGSSEFDQQQIPTPPTHTKGEEYNGINTLKLSADVLLLNKVVVVDLDTSLSWALFPTMHGAVEYIDTFYNTYGRQIRASTKLYHLHHFEDNEGSIINYISPQTSFDYAPINVITKQPYLLSEYKIITNYDYEYSLNESKRLLRLIGKNTLNQMLSQLKEAIS